MSLTFRTACCRPTVDAVNASTMISEATGQTNTLRFIVFSFRSRDMFLAITAEYALQVVTLYQRNPADDGELLRFRNREIREKELTACGFGTSARRLDSY